MFWIFKCLFLPAFLAALQSEFFCVPDWNEITQKTWELLRKFKSSGCVLHPEIPSSSFDFCVLNLWSAFAWLRQAMSSWEDSWIILCLSGHCWGCSLWILPSAFHALQCDTSTAARSSCVISSGSAFPAWVQKWIISTSSCFSICSGPLQPCGVSGVFSLYFRSGQIHSWLCGHEKHSGFLFQAEIPYFSIFKFSCCKTEIAG